MQLNTRNNTDHATQVAETVDFHDCLYTDLKQNCNISSVSWCIGSKANVKMSILSLLYHSTSPSRPPEVLDVVGRSGVKSQPCLTLDFIRNLKCTTLICLSRYTSLLGQKYDDCLKIYLKLDNILLNYLIPI